MNVSDKNESVTRLRELLSPGEELYTTVTHVSPSGMTRWIRVLLIRDNHPVDISWHVARALQRPVNTRNHEGVETGGCGMDMGFELVYSLSRRLYPEGYECIGYDADGNSTGRICPANDHVNKPYPHVLMQHRDGGYALNQRWL